MTSSSSSSSLPFLPQLEETLTLMIPLIPGLPDDLGAYILSLIPYAHHSRLKLTCKSWLLFLSSGVLRALRHGHRRFSHLLCIFPQDPHISSPFLFDPETISWRPLPPMPCNPHEYGLCNFTSVSLNHHVYVLGGSLFDTRSFPLDRPSPSSAAFRYNFLTSEWERLAPMLSPRGSFACAAVDGSGQIIVAGGGSRHTMFKAAGSRICSVERYDVGRDEWVALDGLPRFRAGCVGFVARREGDETDQFWVMGGYGESRTVSGVFPVDEYYRDAVVMELNGTGKWREIGDMWGAGERPRLGKIVVAEDEDTGRPSVFMLDYNDILRYNMASNSWQKEASVPRKALSNNPFGFVGLGEELHVITVVNNGSESMEARWSRQQKRVGTLFIQVYHHRKKTWRSLVTKQPFEQPLDICTAVMCSVRL